MGNTALFLRSVDLLSGCSVPKLTKPESEERPQHRADARLNARTHTEVLSLENRPCQQEIGTFLS